jgi:hypothetical protein
MNAFGKINQSKVFRIEVNNTGCIKHATIANSHNTSEIEVKYRRSLYDTIAMNLSFQMTPEMLIVIMTYCNHLPPVTTIHFTQ